MRRNCWRDESMEPAVPKPSVRDKPLDAISNSRHYTERFLASKMTTLPVSPSGLTHGRSAAEVSEVMSRVRSEGTEPEKLLRRALRREGIRSFRVCDASLPGKPDIVIPGKKLAIFVDGDYWHGNQYRLRGFDSLQDQLFGVNNATYWSTKISRNIQKDLENTAGLLSFNTLTFVR